MVLEPAGRAPGLPEDTAATPLVARVRGFLEAEAAVGEPAAVRTLAARRVEGTLVRLHPAPGHSFGEPVPELLADRRRAARAAGGARQVADRSYGAVLARRGEIQRRAVGVDYEAFEQDGVAFDYEALLRSSGYGLDDVVRIQREAKVGGTPLLELPRPDTARARPRAAGQGSHASSSRTRPPTRPEASRRGEPRSRCTRRRGSATRA